MKSFQGTSYHHRLARYLLKHKGRSAFESFVHQLGTTFDQRDLAALMGQHCSIYTSKKAQRDFTERMHQLAIARFPEHIPFVENLLRLYDRWGFSRTKDPYFKGNFYRLGLRYAAVSPPICQKVLSRLRMEGKLLPYLKRLREQESKNLAESILSYRMARYLSEYEEAAACLRSVVEVLPLHPVFAKELASLSRSLAHSFYLDEPELDRRAMALYQGLYSKDQIGRASCRERVCHRV